MPIDLNVADRMGFRALRGALYGCALAMMTTLAGCANTDVEFQGGLFEMVGLTSLNSGKKAEEAKVPQRVGLVLPPDDSRLPEPGTAPQTLAGISGDAAWPVDPEEAKSQRDEALRREHAAFCEVARRKAAVSANGEIEDGPLGSCRQSIITSIMGRDMINDNLNSKKKP